MTLPCKGIRAGLLVLAGAVVVAGAKADARGLQAQPLYCDGVTRLSFDGAIVASANNKIVYNDIGTTPEGMKLRLIISNTTSFTPSKDASVYTGISGNIAQIGMHLDPEKGQAGGTCFDFSFENAETGEAATINNLILTFFDLDNVHNEYCHEVLRACENAEYFTSATSQLEISRTDECTELMSMIPGTRDNNPTDSKNLATGQRAQSVGMHLTTPVSTINVCFRVAGQCTETDRELLFSGPSQIDGCHDSGTAPATATNVQPTAAPATAAPATAAPAAPAPTTAAPTTAAPTTVAPTTVAPTTAAPATLAPETTTTLTTTSSLGGANTTLASDAANVTGAAPSGNSSSGDGTSADSSSANPTDAASEASGASAGTAVATDSGGSSAASPDGSVTDAQDSPSASLSTTPKEQGTTDSVQSATVEAVPSAADGAPGPDDMVLPEHDACEDSCFYDGQLETCYGLINTLKTVGVSGKSESMKADGVPCVNAWAVVRDQCSECGRCDLKRACVENLNEVAFTTPRLVSGGIRMATLVALGILLVGVSSLSSLVRRRAHDCDRTPEGSDAENELLNPRV